MRFVHISDLHIGKRLNGVSLIEDQRHILAATAALARERQADAVVIAGDIYDKASPSAEAVTVFDGFLTEIARAGMRVLAVPGNHDSAERIAYAHGLLAAQGVSFPPVFAGEIESVEISDAHGPVVFWLVPFLKPGDVRRFFPDASIGDDYGAALQAALSTCELDPAKRNVAIAHQFVTARGSDVERADDEIKLGGIDAVDISAFDAFDYVALGHVHRPQRIGRETARYSGSPLKYAFSEARYAKGAVVVELGAKEAGCTTGACVTHEFVALAPLHDMREVRTTLAELLASAAADSDEADEGGEAATTDATAEGPGADADSTSTNSADANAASVHDPNAPEGNSSAGTGAADPSLDYLHITLTDEHPQLDAMARIHEVFPNALTLDYDNAALLAAREHVRSAIDPDEIDAVELFAQFYEEQTGTALDDVQNSIVKRAVRTADETLARGEKRGKEGSR